MENNGLQDEEEEKKIKWRFHHSKRKGTSNSHGLKVVSTFETGRGGGWGQSIKSSPTVAVHTSLV